MDQLGILLHSEVIYLYICTSLGMESALSGNPQYCSKPLLTQ